MAIPSSYDATTLAEFMEAELGGLAAVLGWAAADDDFDAAVDRALELYGVTSIDDASNVLKLRAVARVALWESVVTEVTLDYDFSADGGSYSRSQLFEQANARLEKARLDAADYLGELLITTDEITWDGDPYA